MQRKRVLGLDIGNVILVQVSGTKKDGTPIDGALDAIRNIVASGKFSEVYLVSKCGRRVRQRTVEWLRSLNFWEYTGIPESHLKFCWTNPGKCPICWWLGITHFVDDRVDVLNHLRTVENRYLFGVREHERFIAALDWKDLSKLLASV